MTLTIESLLDLEKYPAARQYGAEEYDLDRYTRWLELLGSPHRHQQFVHIAGTKGKGSTAAICEAILGSIGFPTALYSSPHLEHFGQRFRFDGVPWTLEQFEERLQNFHHSLTPEQRHGLEGPKQYRTVFELLTALAFVEYKRRGEMLLTLPKPLPQIAILETGLGGRLDCTNVVDPVVSVIVALGLDHTGTLGNTLEKIAFEKAGIIKRGRPAIVSRQPSPETEAAVIPTILARATDVGAPIVRAQTHNPIRGIVQRESGQQLSGNLPNGEEFEAFLPLLGEHQLANAEAAIAAAWYVARENGITPTGKQIARGLGEVRWPGRLEVHHNPDGRRLILDGAHCPLSATLLGRELHRMKGEKPYTLLLGMQRDKDAETFLRALTGTDPTTIGQVITYPVTGPRAAPPADLATAATRLGLKTQTTDTIPAAFQAAVETGADIIATGTLYTLADFRKLWMGNR